MQKTYSIKANATAKDVITNNDITLETGLSLQEAKIASLEHQRQGHHIAVWIEPETNPAPRIVRSIEQDRTGVKYAVVTIDGWPV